jgi:hypothetical protein
MMRHPNLVRKIILGSAFFKRGGMISVLLLHPHL